MTTAQERQPDPALEPFEAWVYFVSVGDRINAEIQYARFRELHALRPRELVEQMEQDRGLA